MKKYIANLLPLLLFGLFGSCHTKPADAEPGLYVNSAYNANVKAGQIVKPGYAVATKKNGSAIASFASWGVSSLLITPNSSATLTSYGFCFGGGRVSQFNISNEVYVTTRRKTHACTEIVVCIKGSQSCAVLNSAIRIARIDDKSSVIAVSEGHILGKVRGSQETKVIVLADEYTIATNNGSFSPAKAILAEPAIVLTRTKTVQTLQVPEGYFIELNGHKARTLQMPIGLTYKLINPLGQIDERNR